MPGHVAVNRPLRTTDVLETSTALDKPQPCSTGRSGTDLCATGEIRQHGKALRIVPLEAGELEARQPIGTIGDAQRRGKG